MFTATEIVEELAVMAVSHVIWVPDSVIGLWEQALEEADALELIRVCREGEAWPVAAGLLLGGQSPLIMMQTTGLFESGDALRNVVYDLALPVFALVGARNWQNENSHDSARRFTRPILDAWNLQLAMISSPDDKPKLREHYQACRAAGQAGIALLAE